MIKYLKNKWFYIAIFMIALLAIIIFLFPFNFKDSSSLISLLIQSEAAIIAIVVSLSLVAVQIATQSYSVRVIGAFSSNYKFWFFVGIYLSSISLGLIILLLIDIGIMDNNKINFLFYCISFIAIITLAPYILFTFNLMKGTNIIDNLINKITEKSILKANGSDEDDIIKNPIQPIMDVLHSSLIHYDTLTVKYGLRKLKTRIISLLEDKNIGRDNKIEIFNSVLSPIKDFGTKSSNKKDIESTIESIDTILAITKSLIDVNYNKKD